ncbi:MAG: FAD-dependent oxidoreductase [Bacteroidota bacterium]
MHLSYWEYKTWLSDIDFTIVGSGIVGLNSAIHLKKRFPDARILILERGMLPQGASTKNAGFACFGSISEILADLDIHSEEAVFKLVEQRWQGIQSLRTLLGDENIGFKAWGGHELFLEKDETRYQNCLDRLDEANQLLGPIFKKAPFVIQDNHFQFKKIQPSYISHQFEGQIDTGQMMQHLLHLAHQKGIQVLNNVEVMSFLENTSEVSIVTDKFEFKTSKLLITTNGFASQLLDEEVQPARAQVLLTEPIENLHIKGTFHFDEGYFYFRNIDNRILFGGGRNLDFEGEQTTSFGQTDHIQNKLEHYLTELVLPDREIKIAHRWSGIMGVGHQKTPIIKQVSDHVFCAVRLGGMGVAIGSHVGQQLAQRVTDKI